MTAGALWPGRRRPQAAAFASVDARGDLAVEVQPLVIGEIVQLAAPHDVHVRAPVEAVIAEFRELFAQHLLRFAQREHRDPRVQVMRVVFHDVVHQAVHAPRKAHAGSGREVSTVALPFLAVLEPGDARVGVVQVHHEADHAVPQQERDDDGQRDEQRDRLLRCGCGVHDDADPGGGERRHEQAVELVLAAARADFLLAGEEQLLPPHFIQVIRAPAEAGSIQPLEGPAVTRQRIEFGLGVGRPDLVAALEVIEAVVSGVVSHLPQAERGHRRQERDSPADGIEPRAREEAAMAGIVADEKEPDDRERHDQHAEQFQQQAVGQQDDRGPRAEECDVEQQHQGRQQDLGLGGLEGTQQGFAVPGAGLSACLHVVGRLIGP